MKLRRTLPVAAVVACTAMAACADSPTSEGPSVPIPQAPTVGTVAPNFVPGTVIVRFRPGAKRAEVVEGEGARLLRPLALERIMVLAVKPGTELEVAARLNEHPSVEWAEPDYVISVLPCEVGLCQENLDTFFGFKWDLHNDGTINNGAAFLQNTGMVDGDIDWQEMYDYLGPSFAGSAVIGILDTGIRKTHQDLAGKVIGERNFITTDPAQVGNAADDNSHGTHVSGIAAARGNNSLGVSGVGYGPNIKLLAAKVCNAAGSCPTSATANAIVWATDNGANVLNMSLSGFGSATVGSQLQKVALEYAVANNVLPVCSTGNDALKTNPATNNPVYTGGIAFPSRFEECLAVGATSWSDTHATYSNHGPGIDVSAPGGDGNAANTPYSLVLSTTLSGTSNTTYSWKAGTSMSAPQVAGLAAVLFAIGITDADDVRARIIASVDDLGPPGWDEKFGWGRINAYRAVTGLDPDAPPVARAGGPYAANEGSSIGFDGSQSADPNGKPITFAWTFGDGGNATGAQPSHAYADNGSYSVGLTVTDQAGNNHVETTSATIANVAPAVNLSVSSSSVATGGTLGVQGSFSDPGVLDAPWSYAVSWGDASSTGGQTSDQGSPISAQHQMCGVGTRTVQLTVTDKDGGSGSASAVVSVEAIGVQLSGPGSFNPNSNGRLPVKVLSTPGFDATDIDPATVRLGDAPVAKRNNGTWMASHEDADGDGDLDLVLHFDRQQVPTVSPMVLTGTLDDGCRAVVGGLEIRIH